MIFSPEFSEMIPCRKKFPKFDKIVRNIFRGIFFSGGNFPGELSDIYRNKTLVYSRKFAFFECVTSL